MPDRQITQADDSQYFVTDFIKKINKSNAPYTPAKKVICVQAAVRSPLGVLSATRGPPPHASLFVVVTTFTLNTLVLEMDADKTTTASGGDNVDVADGADSFTKVQSKKCRKRQREGGDMDTEESGGGKRPHFPPISGDKLKVSGVF